MKIMQKANRQIKVEDKDAAKCLADGWSEVDKKGKVVQKGAGEKKVADLKKTIASLKAENDAIKAENDALKDDLEKTKQK